MTSTIAYAPNLNGLLAAAEEMAAAAGSNLVGTEHVLLAMLRDLDTVPVAELRTLGMEADVALAQLTMLVRRNMDDRKAAQIPDNED